MSPASTVVAPDVNLSQIEPGVRLYPGCTIEGPRTILRAGTELGRAGGGTFKNVAAGRNVSLWGGAFDDCTFLDGASLRGNAEVRGGSLLEEGAEGAHTVGLKMTILLCNVVVGSLINFRDALVAGGTSRKDHSEVGSCLALYNFTPWGDKFASQFGDVPTGVTLRGARIFVGGQAQIVSPVRVGYGAVIPAGVAVRRDVPDFAMASNAAPTPGGQLGSFDTRVLGAVAPKYRATVTYIANLWALRAWYTDVRIPCATDVLQSALLQSAVRQIDAGIAERIKRLDKWIARLPDSVRHLRAAADAKSHRRAAEQQRLVDSWSSDKARLQEPVAPNPHGAAEGSEVFKTVVDKLTGAGSAAATGDGSVGWIDRICSLDETSVVAVREALQAQIDARLAPLGGADLGGVERTVLA